MAFISIAECGICSQLDEVESSFEKWGWEEQARRLPPVASRLDVVGLQSSRDVERHQVRRCPNCGTYYRYDWEYEYLVNGSEDEETLARLTPTEAREYLSDEEYAERLVVLESDLSADDARARLYAARSLTDHSLACGDEAKIERLLAHPDSDVVAGARMSLARHGRRIP